MDRKRAYDNPPKKAAARWVVSAAIALISSIIIIVFVGKDGDALRNIVIGFGLFVLITLLMRLLIAVFSFMKRPPASSVPAISCTPAPIRAPASRSGFSVTQLPSGPKEAAMMSKQWLKQAADTVKIINTTKKASVFFERFDFFEDTLERLAYCEKWVRFSGELPSTKLRFFEEERKEQTRLFILRYAQDTREKMYELATPRGKQNKADAYYNTLTEYSGRMDDENVLLFSEQYELLKQSV